MAGVTQSDKVPGGCFVHQWTLSSADPIGASAQHPGAADRSVQFSSASWGGATAVLEGSIDDITFFVLTDPQGNAITKSADALEAVMENVRYLRPRLSVVGAGAEVAVLVLSRSTMR